ncbi:MAG TPA: glutamyl-tRNA reductase [Fibrobacteria bacterium]|nr:glutamyl-tRNA reductase [Fibrobacteria bacterium]
MVIERPVFHAGAVGVSWKTAPAELRDRCLLPPERADALVERLRETGVREMVVLSTCNRVEVWTASEDPERTASTVLDVWSEVCGLEREWTDRAYVHHHEAAVEHIYRVAASVDSLVLGETQIPSQVRSAWERSRDLGQCGFFLGKLVQGALTASKRVRSQTRLGEGALSVAGAAVDLARKISGDIERLAVGIVGAGEMAELALSGFVRAGARKFVYANRTTENLRRFTTLHPGRVEGLEALDKVLAECDVVVAATGSPGFVIGHALVAQAMKGRRRPLFLLDIAAPRDIDPEVARCAGVFLYGIDDLEQVVDKNRLSRDGEAQLAESLLASEVERFRVWWRSLAVVPVLAQVRGNIHAVAQAEVDRFQRRVRQAASEEELRSVLQDFAQALANKFLHGPTVGARRAASEGRDLEIAAALRDLFLQGDHP